MKYSCPMTEHNHHATYKKQPINHTEVECRIALAINLTK